MAAPATLAGINGGTTQPATTLPQSTVIVPKGTMTPVNLNLNNLQKVLMVVKDRNTLRQVLTGSGKQTPPVFTGHKQNNKVIIRYVVSPAATTQHALLAAKLSPAPPPIFIAAAAPTPSTTDAKSSTPEVSSLSVVKAGPEPVAIADDVTQTESLTAQRSKVNSTSTCLLCDDCPDNLEALHLLQHYKAANGEAIDSAALDPSFAALLSEAGVTLEEPPVDDLLSLLKTYFASNANPSEQELTKISESVSIPVDVVRKWFAKINSSKNVAKYHKAAGVTQPDSTAESVKPGDQLVVSKVTMDAHTKPLGGVLPLLKQQEQPTFVTTPQPVSGEAAAQLRSLAVMAGQSANDTTKKSGSPQLAYVYVTAAASKESHPPAQKKVDSSLDRIPKAEEQSDTDLTPQAKKRALENRAFYPCDLCPKVFHSYSVLHRHRYEHTEKRPHECNICKKAFKLKHHLIEHSRVHSGEKPYHCETCEKRFSHSGSYSQHMKKHNSYCWQNEPGSQSTLNAPLADSRAATPPSHLNSEERESDVSMDDIRVVHVEDGVCEIYEGNFEDDDDEDDDSDKEDTMET